MAHGYVVDELFAKLKDGNGNAITSAARGSERALSVQLVDASGNQITSFSGGTQYAEDAAHATGDTGTLALAVRRDTAAAGSGTNGDYSTLNVDTTGRLWANTELPDAAALADGASNPTTPTVGAANLLWDGSSGWDREPGPQSGSLLSSASRSTTTASASQSNRGHRGVLLMINITSAGGGGQSVTIHLEAFNSVTGTWMSLLGADIALTGTGHFGYELSPGAAGGVNSADGYMLARVGGSLPRTWRANVVHSGGNSWTYSVAYALLR